MFPHPTQDGEVRVRGSAWTIFKYLRGFSVNRATDVFHPSKQLEEISCRDNVGRAEREKKGRDRICKLGRQKSIAIEQRFRLSDL